MTSKPKRKPAPKPKRKRAETPSLDPVTLRWAAGRLVDDAICHETAAVLSSGQQAKALKEHGVTLRRAARGFRSLATRVERQQRSCGGHGMVDGPHAGVGATMGLTI